MLLHWFPDLRTFFEGLWIVFQPLRNWNHNNTVPLFSLFVQFWNHNNSGWTFRFAFHLWYENLKTHEMRFSGWNSASLQPLSPNPNLLQIQNHYLSTSSFTNTESYKNGFSHDSCILFFPSWTWIWEPLMFMLVQGCFWFLETLKTTVCVDVVCSRNFFLNWTFSVKI